MYPRHWLWRIRWGLWQNSQGGRWPDRTTPNSTLTQGRWIDAQGCHGHTQDKIWQGWRDNTTPICIQRGVQVGTTDRPNKSAHQFTSDTPYQRDSTTYSIFNVIFYICYHSAGGDQQILPPLLGHTTQWTFSSSWNYWNISAFGEHEN